MPAMPGRAGGRPGGRSRPEPFSRQGARRGRRGHGRRRRAPGPRPGAERWSRPFVGRRATDGGTPGRCVTGPGIGAPRTGVRQLRADGPGVNRVGRRRCVFALPSPPTGLRLRRVRCRQAGGWARSATPGVVRGVRAPPSTRVFALRSGADHRSSSPRRRRRRRPVRSLLQGTPGRVPVVRANQAVQLRCRGPPDLPVMFTAPAPAVRALRPAAAAVCPLAGGTGVRALLSGGARSARHLRGLLGPTAPRRPARSERHSLR